MSNSENHLNNASTAVDVGLFTFFIGFIFPLVWIVTAICIYGFIESMHLHTQHKERERQEKARQEELRKQAIKRQKALEQERIRQYELERLKLLQEQQNHTQDTDDYEEPTFKDWLMYYGGYGLTLIFILLLICFLLGLILGLLIGK